MKLGREVSRHNELANWRNTHRFESVMATKWLLLTISETEPGLWDRLLEHLHYLSTPKTAGPRQYGVKDEAVARLGAVLALKECLRTLRLNIDAGIFI